MVTVGVRMGCELSSMLRCVIVYRSVMVGLDGGNKERPLYLVALTVILAFSAVKRTYSLILIP